MKKQCSDTEGQTSNAIKKNNSAWESQNKKAAIVNDYQWNVVMVI